MYISFTALLLNYIPKTDEVLCLLWWDYCLNERRKYCGCYLPWC